MKLPVFLPVLFISIFSFAQKRPDLVDKPGTLRVDPRSAGVFSSVPSLRQSSVDTSNIYRLKISGRIGDFVYDPHDVTSKDDSVMVIVTTDGKRLKRNYDYVDPAWWGAKPGDAIDDSYAIQRAVDYAIKNQAKPRVYFSESGTYRAKNIILANYVHGKPQFFALTIEGPTGAVGAGLGAELYCGDGNAAIMHVQLGRNLVIRNLAFAGIIAAPTVDVVSRTHASWTNNGAVRTNRYSPNAGICIDPFLQDVSERDRYPGLSSWYNGVTPGGTSNLLIENCAFGGLAVGIMVSPSGQANGDNIVCRGGTGYNCKAFWAAGQLQSRANLIEGVYTFAAIETFVDGKTYGIQNGSLPEVRNSSLNSCKYLYNIGSEFSGISFIGCYSEDAWSLGKSNSVNPVSFTDCFINLTSNKSRYAPPVMAEGGLLNFRGGKIEWSDNIWLAALPFNNVQVNFSGTLLRSGVPFITVPIQFGRLQLENIEFANGSQPLRISQNSVLTDFNEGGMNGSYLLPSNRAISDQGFVFENIGAAMEKIYTNDVVTMKVNTAEKTATFTAPVPGRYGIGDVIAAYEPIESPNDIFSPTATSLGYVSQVTGNTVTLSRIPEGINTSQSYHIHIVRIPRWMARMTGSITNGSKTISNIQADGASPIPGHIVKGHGIGAGARIVSVKGNTAEMSVPAYITVANVQLYDAKIKVSRDNQPIYIYGGMWQPLQFTRVYHAGDEIMNTTGEPGLRSWYCTSPGKIGSSTPPVFAEIRQPVSKSLSGLPTPGKDLNAFASFAQPEFKGDHGATTTHANNEDGEEVILVNQATYSVPASPGKKQNVIFEYKPGSGIIFLPTGEQADKMVLYINNSTKNILRFSQDLYSDSQTFTWSLPARSKTKLVYKFSDAKWYQLPF